MIDNITVTITPGDREAVVTHEFLAPATHVFDVMTKAELIRRW